MTYALFDPAKPDASVGSRTDQFTNTRSNLTALADMLAGFAGMQGFDVAIVSSNAYGPTVITATNGTQVLKKTIAYNGSGVTEGLPDTIDYEKSTDGGSSWDSIATQTFNYDGSGNFTDYSWA